MALVVEIDSLLSSFSTPPSTVVSLVPSTTESLLAFGLHSVLVGVTEYCEIPDSIEPHVERLGGTKNPDLSKIIALNPELIIANREENERKSIERLIASDLMVWLTFPTSVHEAIQDLWHLVKLFRIEYIATPRLEMLERITDWAELVDSGQPRPRYFCPIWQSENQEWWMTFNSGTYANDILAYCGGLNVFADRERKYPLQADLGMGEEIDAPGRDRRYPRVTLDEIVEKEPEVILLPSEPYPFDEGHIEALTSLWKQTPAGENGMLHLVDGRLITWHGIRIAQALTELPQFFI